MSQIIDEYDRIVDIEGIDNLDEKDKIIYYLLFDEIEYKSTVDCGDYNVSKYKIVAHNAIFIYEGNEMIHIEYDFHNKKYYLYGHGKKFKTQSGVINYIWKNWTEIF